MTAPALFNGIGALDYLAAAVARPDAFASSHWRDMHRDFRYENGKFHGLRGFGGYSPSPGIARRAAHRLLQRPFRRMGAGLLEFARSEAAAKTVARAQDRAYDLDALRQALTAALLLERAPSRLRPGSTVAVIGDGFGMLSSLLLALAPGVRVVLVNLTRTLLVDLVFLSRAHPSLGFALATDREGLAAALADPGCRAIALQAGHAALLADCPIDLAANVVSMQEMNPDVIASYFSALRAGGKAAFYCCNRVEKTLSDGTVVRFADYPWLPGDEVLLDELCPWNQAYYTWRPPFYRRYDGPIRHRLAILAP